MLGAVVHEYRVQACPGGLHSISTPWVSTRTAEREDFSLEAFAKGVTPTVGF